jgi:hypothetical protein
MELIVNSHFEVAAKNLYETAIMSLIPYQRKVNLISNLFFYFEKFKKFKEELIAYFLSVHIENLI